MRVVRLTTLLFCILRSIDGFAVLPVTNELEEARENTSFIASKNSLNQLLGKVRDAKNVHDEVSALSELNNFAQNPAQSTKQLNDAVSDMLKKFNDNSGTNFTNLPDLISNVLTSSNTKGIMMQLQQAANSQLNDISTSLKQIEAENQAMIKYKQAEIAETEKQKSDFVKDAESVRDGFDATAKVGGSSPH